MSDAVRPVLVPLTFRQACTSVREWHRHHAPPRGHKFSIGAAVDGQLVGAVMVGRPVSRFLDNGHTLEVTRCATDGTPNICSFLYAAARQATYALGFDRLVTYTQAAESGSSLRGAGWRVIAQRPPRATGWSRPSRPREELGTENVQRLLWEAS